MSTQSMSFDPIVNAPRLSLVLQKPSDGVDAEQYFIEKLHAWQLSQNDPQAKQQSLLSKAEIAAELQKSADGEQLNIEDAVSNFSHDEFAQLLEFLSRELGGGWSDAQIAAQSTTGGTAAEGSLTPQERSTVIDFLSNLSVMVLADLIKTLETKWGVEPYAINASAAAASGPAIALAGEEYDPAAASITYLNKSMLGHQVGSLVYSRTSNMGTEHWIIGNVLKYAGGIADLRSHRQLVLSHQEQTLQTSGLSIKSKLPWDMSCNGDTQPPVNPVAERAAVTKFVMLTLNSLGLMPGGGTTTAVGTFLIDSIWPSGDKTEWDKAFEAVTKFVKEEEIKRSIDSAKTGLSSIIDLIHVNYSPLKNAGTSSHGDLFATIQSYLPIIEDALKTLNKDTIIQQGLEPFCYGVSLLMVCLQESAYQNVPANPRSSGAVSTIETEANKYSKRVKDVIELMVTERMSCISDVLADTKTTYHSTGHQTGSTTKTDGYYFTDAFVRYRSKISYFKKQKDRSKHREAVEKELARYRINMESTYRNDLAFFNSMAEDWAELAKNPLAVIPGISS